MDRRSMLLGQPHWRSPPHAGERAPTNYTLSIDLGERVTALVLAVEVGDEREAAVEAGAYAARRPRLNTQALLLLRDDGAAWPEEAPRQHGQPRVARIVARHPTTASAPPRTAAAPARRARPASPACRTSPRPRAPRRSARSTRGPAARRPDPGRSGARRRAPARARSSPRARSPCGPCRAWRRGARGGSASRSSSPAGRSPPGTRGALASSSTGSPPTKRTGMIGAPTASARSMKAELIFSTGRPQARERVPST